MIVRISTEGQYRLSSAVLDQVNSLDNALVEHIANSDIDAFQKSLGELLDLVRNQGEKVGADELVESHVILPTPDITIDEAREFFTGDGLFPD